MLALISGSIALPLEAISCLEERAVTTDWGEPAAAPRRCAVEGGEFWHLNRHGNDPRRAPHRIPARANIAALKQLGVTRILGLAAAGGIGAHLAPGSLVLPHQLIDYTIGGQHSFRDPWCEFDQHIDFTEPFDGDLRQSVLRAAAGSGVMVLDGGVLGCTCGPRLETAAEITRLQRDGCDLVNMTVMPEASLAREQGLAYANLSVVVNAAAGLGSTISLAAMIEQMDGAQQYLWRLLAAWLQGECER